jgi:hypothetical protein
MGAPATGSVAPIPMLDYKGTGNSGSIYQPKHPTKSTQGAGALQWLVYMNATDSFIVRVASASTAIGVTFPTDASSYIKIAKLK